MSAPGPARARILARLATALAATSAERPLPWRLCEVGRQVFNADTAAITIETSALNRVTVAATDALAARLEDMQDVVGEGPSRDAFRQGVSVRARMDDAPRSPWPRFLAVAYPLVGAAAVAALPIAPDGNVIGVLTVWDRAGTALAADEVSAQLVSNAVGAALLRDPHLVSLSENLGTWATRSEIHQATGMVMAQLKIDGDDALDLLKARAYTDNVELATIARLVLDRTVDFRGDQDA